MKQTLVITDLTQMPQADRVCIAGITGLGTCVRPVDPGGRVAGISKQALYSGSALVVRPGSRVEFDVSPIQLEPPHIEDRVFDPSHVVTKGRCTTTEFETILKLNAYRTVAALYDECLHENRWVAPGAKTRSLGTLISPRLIELTLSGNSVKPRLRFSDGASDFDCPVADLTLRELCFGSVKRRSLEPTKVVKDIQNGWAKARATFLRLGLARPFRVSPFAEPRCYLQVTGVYSFPDYLDGKTFADF